MKKVDSRAQAADACIKLLDTDFFLALCEPARMKIFRHLVLFGRSDVGSVAREMPQDRSVITRHLQVMERAGVLRSETEGRNTFYEVDGTLLTQRLEQAVQLMRGLVPLCCPSKDQ
jgi:ArsR family transcriptional regulator, zinc-responsive transcriptional repressor